MNLINKLINQSSLISEFDNCLHVNLDMVGSDVFHDKSKYKSPQHCQRWCDQKPSCLGFSWIDGNCHLKPKNFPNEKLREYPILPFPSYTPGVISGYKNCGNNMKYIIIHYLILSATIKYQEEK